MFFFLAVEATSKAIGKMEKGTGSGSNPEGVGCTEGNGHRVSKVKKYLKYIQNRPNVDTNTL